MAGRVRRHRDVLQSATPAHERRYAVTVDDEIKRKKMNAAGVYKTSGTPPEQCCGFIG